MTKLVLRHSVQSEVLVCTLNLKEDVETRSWYWLHQAQKIFSNAKKFNMMLETVDLDEETGHLFVVDIKFDETRANTKTSMIW